MKLIMTYSNYSFDGFIGEAVSSVSLNDAAWELYRMDFAHPAAARDTIERMDRVHERTRDSGRKNLFRATQGAAPTGPSGTSRR